MLLKYFTEMIFPDSLVSIFHYLKESYCVKNFLQRTFQIGFQVTSFVLSFFLYGSTCTIHIQDAFFDSRDGTETFLNFFVSRKREV